MSQVEKVVLGVCVWVLGVCEVNWCNAEVSVFGGHIRRHTLLL